MEVCTMSWKSCVGVLVYAGALLGADPSVFRGQQEQAKPPIDIMIEQCENSVHLSVSDVGMPAGLEVVDNGNWHVHRNVSGVFVTCPRGSFHFRHLVTEDDFVQVTLSVIDVCFSHANSKCYVVELQTGREVQIEDRRSRMSSIHEHEEPSPHGFTSRDESDPSLGARIEISKPESASPARLEGTIEPLAEPVEIPLNLPKWKPRKKEERKSQPYRGPTALAQSELGTRLKAAERRFISVEDEDESGNDLLSLHVDVHVSKGGQVQWSASTKGDIHISQVLKFLELLNPPPPSARDDGSWVPRQQESKTDDDPEVIEGTLLDPKEPAPDPNATPAPPSRLPRY
jgi:hypothetical protein